MTTLTREDDDLLVLSKIAKKHHVLTGRLTLNAMRPWLGVLLVPSSDVLSAFAQGQSLSKSATYRCPTTALQNGGRKRTNTAVR
jgi:hypothetical protein